MFHVTAVQPLVLCSFGIVLLAQISQAAECIECEWDPWNSWSSCSVTRGEGTRARTRGLCCKGNLKFDECVTYCNTIDTSYENNTCGFVCPEGNCSLFQEVNDTGIKATDFSNLTGHDPLVVINPPIYLVSTIEFCRESCIKANLQNGLFCWAYTYNNTDKCFLHFHKHPLTIIHFELQGQSSAERLFLRRCIDANSSVNVSSNTFHISVTGSNASMSECNETNRESDDCHTGGYTNTSSMPPQSTGGYTNTSSMPPQSSDQLGSNAPVSLILAVVLGIVSLPICMCVAVWCFCSKKSKLSPGSGKCKEPGFTTTSSSTGIGVGPGSTT